MRVVPYGDNTFAGINNRQGNLRNRSNVIKEVSNMDLTDSSELRTREGLNHRLTLANITSAFFTADQTRLYVVADGVLYRVYDDLSTQELATGINGTSLFWSEFGSRIGISGSACGVIRTETEQFVEYPLARPTQLFVTVGVGDLSPAEYMLTVVEIVNGEQTPAARTSYIQSTENSSLRVTYTPSINATSATIYCSEPNGSVLYEVHTAGTTGTTIVEINSRTQRLGLLDETVMKAAPLHSYEGPNAFFSSSWIVSTYDPSANTSYLYKSAVFSYGMFDLLGGYDAVPGRVTLLKSHPEGLLIGTTQGIWVKSSGEQMLKLASTPVPEHVSSVTDREGTIWFWTDRGLAKGLPYEEVTAERLDPDSSNQVSLGLVEDALGDKIIVVLKD